MSHKSPSTSVLVVGLGSIGLRHARLLAERDDVEFDLCDAKPERLAAANDLPRPPRATYTDLAQALAQRPELAFICTPNHLHVPLARQAIAAGADLLVEKPIADSLDEARQLAADARAAGRFFHVGYMMRFEPGLRHVRQMVQDGAIGEPVAARAMIGTYITLLNAVIPYRLHTPYALLVDYTHEFDYIRWTLGDTRDVFSIATSLGRVDLKPPQNVIASTLRLASGAIVQVHMDYVQFPQRRIFEVMGDRGAVSYDVMTAEFRYYPHGKAHEFEVTDFSKHPDRGDGMYRRQLASILEKRRQGEAPEVSAEDGVAALEVAHAAMRSAESGKMEPVRP